MSNFKVGDVVILGKHSHIKGFGVEWSWLMDRFVGTKATLLGIYDKEEPIRWIVSGNDHKWRQANFTRVVEYPDQVCNECKKPCPHEAPNQYDKSYTCPGCLFLRELRLCL
jgi:hypothetical protein